MPNLRFRGSKPGLVGTMLHPSSHGRVGLAANRNYLELEAPVSRFQSRRPWPPGHGEVGPGFERIQKEPDKNSRKSLTKT